MPTCLRSTASTQVGLQDAADSVGQMLEVSRRAVESIRFLERDRHRKISVDFREHEFTDYRKFVDQHWKDEGIFTRSKRLTCKKSHHSSRQR